MFSDVEARVVYNYCDQLHYIVRVLFRTAVRCLHSREAVGDPSDNPHIEVVDISAVDISPPAFHDTAMGLCRTVDTLFLHVGHI